VPSAVAKCSSRNWRDDGCLYSEHVARDRLLYCCLYSERVARDILLYCCLYSERVARDRLLYCCLYSSLVMSLLCFSYTLKGFISAVFFNDWFSLEQYPCVSSVLVFLKHIAHIKSGVSFAVCNIYLVLHCIYCILYIFICICIFVASQQKDKKFWVRYMEYLLPFGPETSLCISDVL